MRTVRCIQFDVYLAAQCALLDVFFLNNSPIKNDCFNGYFKGTILNWFSQMIVFMVPYYYFHKQIKGTGLVSKEYV